MTQKVRKAVVATVALGNIEFEGLMLPNGDYAIAVSQLSSLNLVRQNQASRDVKALLGEGFAFYKTSSELNSRPVNVLLLSDFERLIFELALKGNAAAQELCRQLIGLSLTQFFSDAFGQKFEKVERQQYLKDRQEGKFIRRTFTDSIQDYIARHPELSENESKWLYRNASDTLNKLLFGKTAKQLCDYYKCDKNKLRDQFERKDVVGIRRLEEYSMRMVDDKDVHPLEAIKQAFEFWDGARI